MSEEPPLGRGLKPCSLYHLPNAIAKSNGGPSPPPHGPNSFGTTHCGNALDARLDSLAKVWLTARSKLGEQACSDL